jgi:serine/threonine protein kinase
MIGETILHYKILEKLGEGGMGIVYKAEDTTLNRNVALKFLPNYLTSDSNEKERFYHEARAAAALMHHNVAVIHEIGEHNGQVFIAMEYVEGQTLKKIIQEKSDTLTINKVLDIAIQICEGLAAAHEKAIVHRDIKSENIMLTSKGRIKLMDFGLAKISGATKLTKDGSTVGTAAYMSPEQALGEEVDNRSDIFSFGIVLYELLTTHLPFDAEHQAALVYSIINEYPQPIARFNTKVSSEIERIVFKALTKDKNERYQHIDDLLADLRKERKNLEYSEAGYVKTSSAQQIVQNQSDILQKGNKSGAFVNKRSVIISVSVTALVTLIALSYLFLFNKGSSANTTSNFNKSIAVLPFENLSSDKNNAYFASGTEDMILTKLAGIGGLKVISRTSTDRYKSQPEDLRTVAKQLGVTTVLEGSVQKSKNEVLINVQLIDAKTDSHIWAKAYTRTLDNVFDVEGEVAGKIAQALQIKLIPQETKDLHSKPTNNSQAYDLFLKAKYQIYLFHKLGKVPNAALKLYHGAIALDTTFALAYAGLSGAEQIMYELKSYNDSLLIQALLHANDAVRIDSGLAEGYFQLGSIYRIKGEYKKAKTAFDKTFKISPNDPQVLSVLALVDGTHEGLWADALKYIKKATNLDPQNINTIINYANIEFNLGNYDQSIKISNRAYRIDPDNFYAIYGMVNPLIWSGRLEQARNILKQKR